MSRQMGLQGAQLWVPGGSCTFPELCRMVEEVPELLSSQQRGGSAQCCPEPRLDRQLLQATLSPPAQPLSN